MNTVHSWQRWLRFVLGLGVSLGFVYGLLPLLTDSVDILQQMSVSLENNQIDPTRYYYTDVEQVAESEQYLRQVIEQ